MKARSSYAVDALVVIALFGIVANFAVPAARHSDIAEEAVRVVADIEVIRDAVSLYARNEGRYPAHGAWGEPPGEIQRTLPQGFQFGSAGTQYRWRNWGELSGLSEPLLAVQVRSRNKKLLTAVLSEFKGRIILRRNDQATLVLD